MDINIKTNKIGKHTIGIMGRNIYQTDELVVELKNILEANSIKLPSNDRVLDDPKERIKLKPSQFNKISMKVYCQFIRYRHLFMFKKISTELTDCIDNIYYFVGVYNMLNNLGFIQHIIPFDRRNLMLNTSYRCFFWERTNKHARLLLKSCLDYLKKRKYKQSVEMFFRNGKSNDFYLGSFYRIMDFPNLTEDIYERFGFLKIEEDENTDIYLLPSYLMSSLDPDDKLFLLNSDKYALAKELSCIYTPYYEDKIHLMYGFKKEKEVIENVDL